MVAQNSRANPARMRHKIREAEETGILHKVGPQVRRAVRAETHAIDDTPVEIDSTGRAALAIIMNGKLSSLGCFSWLVESLRALKCRTIRTGPCVINIPGR